MDEFESTETNEPNLHLARPADAVDVRRSVTQRRISGGCSRVTWPLTCEDSEATHGRLLASPT